MKSAHKSQSLAGQQVTLLCALAQKCNLCSRREGGVDWTELNISPQNLIIRVQMHSRNDQIRLVGINKAPLSVANATRLTLHTRTYKLTFSNSKICFSICEGRETESHNEDKLT